MTHIDGLSQGESGDDLSREIFYPHGGVINTQKPLSSQVLRSNLDLILGNDAKVNLGMVDGGSVSIIRVPINGDSSLKVDCGYNIFRTRTDLVPLFLYETFRGKAADTIRKIAMELLIEVIATGGPIKSDLLHNLSCDQNYFRGKPGLSNVLLYFMVRVPELQIPLISEQDVVMAEPLFRKDYLDQIIKRYSYEDLNRWSEERGITNCCLGDIKKDDKGNYTVEIDEWIGNDIEHDKLRTVYEFDCYGIPIDSHQLDYIDHDDPIHKADLAIPYIILREDFFQILISSNMHEFYIIEQQSRFGFPEYDTVTGKVEDTHKRVTIYLMFDSEGNCYVQNSDNKFIEMPFSIPGEFLKELFDGIYRGAVRKL